MKKEAALSTLECLLIDPAKLPTHWGAVNPINGTSVLRVILQETQKTDLGENEVTYDNKTKTKSLPGCVAHLLVAY